MVNQIIKKQKGKFQELLKNSTFNFIQPLFIYYKSICLMRQSLKGYQFMLLIMFPLLTVAQFPWVKPQQLNIGLPSSISIYTLNTTSTPFQTKLTGGYARFDFKDTNLQFVVGHTEDEKSKTPMEWASEETNLVYAVLNGGYFNMALNISASFIAAQGKVYHANTINQQEQKNIYPTIGTFGQFKNGSFGFQYVYSYGQDLATYRFYKPNPIPAPVPDRKTGQLWEIWEGIGAGPLLIKNGIQINGNPENFNLENFVNYRHPRSAACIDNYGRLIFLAIDGRYPGSDGVTISELTVIMKDLNCVDALNLDGGGSTLLYANNKIINKYSDPVPRPVVSAILVIDKHKKKSSYLISEQ